jgi:hypothetical protein
MHGVSEVRSVSAFVCLVIFVLTCLFLLNDLKLVARIGIEFWILSISGYFTNQGAADTSCDQHHLNSVRRNMRRLVNKPL